MQSNELKKANSSFLNEKFIKPLKKVLYKFEINALEKNNYKYDENVYKISRISSAKIKWIFKM